MNLPFQLNHFVFFFALLFLNILHRPGVAFEVFLSQSASIFTWEVEDQLSSRKNNFPLGAPKRFLVCFRARGKDEYCHPIFFFKKYTRPFWDHDLRSGILQCGSIIIMFDTFFGIERAHHFALPHQLQFFPSTFSMLQLQWQLRMTGSCCCPSDKRP